MKVSHIMLTCVFSLVLILNLSFVFAINSNEASVNVSWDTELHYQGDFAPARITFVSNFSQPLEIYYIGINFDWLDIDNFQGSDLSDNPVIVPSYGSHSFEIMLFQIPLNASIGEHDYFVGIDGSYGGLGGSLPTGFSWDSKILTLKISDSLEKTYLDLNTQVSAKINQTSEQTYDSPEANNLLSQALEAKTNANTFALNDQFQEAIISLTRASSFVDLIAEEEQLFDQQQENQNQVILLVFGGVVTVILIVAILLLLKRRKNTSTKLDQTTKSEI
ncbi:hypothetical protein JJE00_03335 [Candidatus Bathyarchaeota archaeon]|nr:hypothetical protein [Candidatus Bathyarchaeota archaeon]